MKNKNHSGHLCAGIDTHVKGAWCLRKHIGSCLTFKASYRLAAKISESMEVYGMIETSDFQD